MIRFFLLILCLSLINFNTSTKEIGSSTGYKIPRFVSIKSDEANLRIGSSKNYPIILQYKIKDMPVEIVDEYENWRKIIDIEGNQGWMHKSLLKGNRFAIIKNKKNLNTQFFSKPNGHVIGEIGKLNIVKIKRCLQKWCLVSKNDIKGWVIKKDLWGVYKNEKINVPFYQPLISFYWSIF